MRFIHLADVHLAAAPESGTELGKIREKEIYQTFQKILRRCEEEQIDLLLIAGDLFHRPPLLRELKEVNYHFSKLSHTKVVLIAGNHDFIGVNSNYLGFAWTDNVTFLDSETLTSVYLEDLNTRVYGLSYHARDYKEALPEDVKPKDDAEIGILMLHGGEEGKLPFDKKKIEAAGFDYVALGHIHRPHSLSRRMAYSGSMEPLDKGEMGEHGYYLGEIEKHGGELCLAFVPAAARRYWLLELTVTPDMTNGEIGDICGRKMEEMGEENIYRIHLSGRRDAELEIDKEMLFSLGIVTEVRDDSVLDFNYLRLEEENRDNLLGMFIRRIMDGESGGDGIPRKEPEDGGIQKKALDYGLAALFQAGVKRR